MSTTSSRLDYVDFVKGLAAISVILLHTLPKSILKNSFAVYHIWQAVPIFIFVSFYLGFRNLEKKDVVFDGYYSKSRLIKVFVKIWLPLIILAGLESIYLFAIGDRSRAIGCLLCIENGPGSYYVWCYMQIWLLIPVIFIVLKKHGSVVGGGDFVNYFYIVGFSLGTICWENACYDML